MRSPCTATKRSPRSPQLEKARVQQRRPNAAKSKTNKINKLIKNKKIKSYVFQRNQRRKKYIVFYIHHITSRFQCSSSLPVDLSYHLPVPFVPKTSFSVSLLATNFVFVFLEMYLPLIFERQFIWILRFWLIVLFPSVFEYIVPVSSGLRCF